MITNFYLKMLLTLACATTGLIGQEIINQTICQNKEDFFATCLLNLEKALEGKSSKELIDMVSLDTQIIIDNTIAKSPDIKEVVISRTCLTIAKASEDSLTSLDMLLKKIAKQSIEFYDLKQCLLNLSNFLKDTLLRNIVIFTSGKNFLKRTKIINQSHLNKLTVHDVLSQWLPTIKKGLREAFKPNSEAEIVILIKQNRENFEKAVLLGIKIPTSNDKSQNAYICVKIDKEGFLYDPLPALHDQDLKDAEVLTVKEIPIKTYKHEGPFTPLFDPLSDDFDSSGENLCLENILLGKTIYQDIPQGYGFVEIFLENPSIMK